MGKQLFSNINLDAIEFANHGNEIKLKFLDSVEIKNEHILELVCKRIKEFKMEVDLDEMDEYILPCFFCDIELEEIYDNNQNQLNYVKYKLQTFGGDMEIFILCNDVEILKK